MSLVSADFYLKPCGKAVKQNRPPTGPNRLSFRIETRGFAKKFPISRPGKEEIMLWDDQRFLVNIREAETDDLLDRVTAYRKGMEPEAIDMIEDELHRRGVSAAEIATHAEICRRDGIFLPDGTAAMCSFCRKPAIREGWGWHWLWRRIPLFPRYFRFCADHDPAACEDPPTDDL